MKRPKEQSISQKITRAVVFVALLSNVILGLAGIISLVVVNHTAQEIYAQNLVPLNPLYLASSDLASIRVDCRTLLTSTGDPSATIHTINTTFDDMKKQASIYHDNISSGVETENYRIIEKGLSDFSAFLGSYEAAISAGDKAQAQTLLTDSVSKSINDAMTKAFTLNVNQAHDRYQSEMILFWCVLAGIITVIAAFMLIALRIGRRVAHVISEPVVKMADVATAIAKGDLEVDLDISTGDETEVLAEACRSIVESLRRLKTDIQMLISETLEGRLDTRADSTAHEGGYREIIDGVNTMLNTIKEPLDTASGFLDRLAEGIHQDDIRQSCKGYFATLTDNLNRVRHSVAILTEEANKLAEAGLNGDLETRGDESRLKGIYAQVIHGVNKTFDAFKDPLDVAAVFISSLAAGEHQEPIQNQYKGYYAALVDNLNDVRASLNYLVEESSKLTQAGSQGDFTARGNAGTLRGSYAHIINGVNQTLDAVVVPLRESGVVLGKMAINDYSSQMSEDYPGLLHDFSVSINAVRERLLAIEKICVGVSDGDMSSLAGLKKIGKRSENDRLMPALIRMMQTIQDLIEDTNRQAEAAVAGDLHIRGDADKFKGEYRKIIDGMNRTMAAVAAPIEESSTVLQQLAQGNLTVEMAGDYAGEYNRIKASLNQAVQAFRELLNAVVISADEVAAGAAQVSDASQSLSQGATEQASSVEELTASVTEIASQTRQNALDAAQASELASATSQEAEQGNEKMHRMLEAMQDINTSSASISKIIKVIDDIAFQTNILALNAAVEAARAGQYGKGFAVVAEEVRNLAGKSAEAAKETTTLIESSVEKVKAGTEMADDTAQMLSEIAESVQKAAVLVGSIATASNEQATAIAQIDQGLSQVSGVVQNNSATAEESAASSEELSGQADMLKQMVGRFSL
ncbi:methyl-accepting chemotaxis protein [Ethanoligenens harbinense]|uniref:Methyl-accepting chemotaxis sensory transducer n=1 Tax=Ethanoligenens harbinense (strain DSM 18485 / JCM 12961 / CGMCC 1.5033 / YUAN-3) TaxID=663278 RepID=E6U314_ETHHY|nr:methyl-accepting chemotaxis protein [Ethanoligenens harbinense]ADU26381.1 methyl-accepting chemotaxis sensory transducer [Ethanoligenens harbinense YUAN-3]